MKFSEILLKFPRIYLISHIIIWFCIGMIVSYLLMCLPMFRVGEFLNITLNLAGWFSLIFGFLGGIYRLLTYSDKQSNW